MVSITNDQQTEVARLVESIALPMARWDRDAKLVFCNSPYERWVGRARETLIGNTLQVLYGHTAWAIARPHFDRAFEGKTSRYERQVRMYSGELRWHRVLVFPDNAESIAPQTVFTVAFDIEDDIRLRQQLAANEARLRSVLESMSIPIARVSAERTLSYCNSTYAALMGRSSQEITGMATAFLLGSEVAKRIEPFYARAFLGETVVYDRQLQNIDPPRWMRVRLQPERDASGETRSIIASMYDIDADVSAKQELENARKRLDDFTDSIPFSLAYIDRDEIYRFANRQFLQRHNLSAEKVIGKHPSVARGEAIWSVNRPYFERAIRGETVHHERPVRLANLEERWTRTVYAPDIDAAGNVRGVYTTSFDIHELKQAQSEIARVDAQLSAHLARSPVAVVEYDKYGTIVQWSKRTEQMLGRTAESMLGTKLTLEFVHPDDQQEVGQVIKQILSGGAQTVVNHHRYRHESGRYVWIEWYTSVMRNEDGTISSILSLGVDRTARVESRLRLQRLADRVPNPITYVGLDRRYEFMNTAYVEWTGISRDTMIGRTPREVRGEELGAMFERAIEQALAGEETSFERAAKRSDGAVRWMKTLVSPDFDANGRVVGCYNVSFDIHDARVREETLRIAADYDPLTSLLTRRALFRELDATLSVSARQPVTVFFIDVDGFKKINDSQGHAAGDDALVEIAKCVRKCMGPREIVGRFGGDEFVVVSIGTNRDQCVALAQALIDSVSSANLSAITEQPISVSIGAVMSQIGSKFTSDELVKLADQAMYVAKREGGGRVRFAAD